MTGAEFRLTLDDVPVEMNRVIEATAGAILKFGERLRGARAYVAVAGGVDVLRFSAAGRHMCSRAWAGTRGAR